MLHDSLVALAAEFDWRLHAWVVLPNHYHFVGDRRGSAENLRAYLAKLHGITAREVNRCDSTPSRRVWFQFWDTQITYESSYLARFKYILNNPVKHGLVQDWRDYRWSSAAAYVEFAPLSFRKTLGAVKADNINVRDDF